MKKSLATVVALALLASCTMDPVFAQLGSPPTPLPSPVFGAVSAPLAVTGTSARVALPNAVATYPNVIVRNTGVNDAFIALGGSTVVATTTGIYVQAGKTIQLWTNQLDLAAITATSTTTLEIDQSNGMTLGY